MPELMGVLQHPEHPPGYATAPGWIGHLRTQGKFFYTEAGNKDYVQFLVTPPNGTNHAHFRGVYRDCSNVESLLESRMVRKAVLSRSYDIGLFQ